jgi:predicted TIM-barrel fold metal-dependent hydrolase
MHRPWCSLNAVGIVGDRVGFERGPREKERSVNLDDLVLVSVDDHVVEPPDVFEGRVSARYRDAAPRIVRKDDGTDAWVYEGVEYPNLALNAVAGRPPEEYGLEPTSYDEIRRGTWDVHERVKDMSACGVLAALNFPSFPRFAGQLFSETAQGDPKQCLEMIRAYNDWHIDEWCGAAPDRLIPMAIPVYFDVDALVAETHRVADKGCHAITFSANPYDLGFPSLHSEYWDPFWAACEERSIVLCMHLGSNSKFDITAPDAPMTVEITRSGIRLFTCASDLIWSPIFRKFPKLTVALSEGGIGWIPYFLERADFVFQHHKAWTQSDFGGRLPSEIFLEHIVTCFIDDEVGVANRERLNLDMITWECDYPHSDSLWPDAPETVFRYLDGLSEEDVRRITHANAMRLFAFDPHHIRPPDSCTVGALRAEVADHDISIRGTGKRASPATLGELALVAPHGANSDA